NAVDGKKTKGSPRDLLRLVAYARPYRGRLALAFICLFAGNFIGLAFPKLVQFLIDAAFIDRDYGKLNRIGLIILIAFAVQAVFGFVRFYLFAFVSERVLADMRTRLYNHLTSLPLSFFDNRRTGELVSRVTSDVTVIQTATTTSLSELLRQIFILVGGVTIIAFTNPKLTMIMLAIVPVVVLFTVFYGRYVRRLSTRVQDKLADANSVLEESLSAIRIVQSFAREAYERARYREKIFAALQMAMKRAVANGSFIAFIIFVVYSAIAAILWFGSRMV